MITFAVETRYHLDKLADVRPKHRAYLQALVDEGKVLAGGPFVDGDSGFAIYRVADRAELDELLAVDPYTTDGVAAERTVREWTIVLGPWAQ